MDVSVLAHEDVLLLEEGHCLRDQALEVCRLAGAAERTGFRATSLETLRQMVAAGVGITLLPELAVAPPVPRSDDITLLRFAEPVPRREIAMYWRNTSAYRDFLPELASVMRELPPGLVDTTRHAAGGAQPLRRRAGRAGTRPDRGAAGCRRRCSPAVRRA